MDAASHGSLDVLRCSFVSKSQTAEVEADRPSLSASSSSSDSDGVMILTEDESDNESRSPNRTSLMSMDWALIGTRCLLWWMIRGCVVAVVVFLVAPTGIDELFRWFWFGVAWFGWFLVLLCNSDDWIELELSVVVVVFTAKGTWGIVVALYRLLVTFVVVVVVGVEVGAGKLIEKRFSSSESVFRVVPYGRVSATAELVVTKTFAIATLFACSFRAPPSSMRLWCGNRLAKWSAGDALSISTRMQSFYLAAAALALHSLSLRSCRGKKVPFNINGNYTPGGCDRLIKKCVRWEGESRLLRGQIII